MSADSMMGSVFVDLLFGEFKQDPELGFVLLIVEDLSDGVFSGDDLRGSENKLIDWKVCDFEVLDEFNDVSFVLFDITVVLVVVLG